MFNFVVCSQIIGKKTPKHLVLRPPELAKYSPPQKLGRVIALGTWVYELDRAHLSDKNPHGVGKYFGSVCHPYGPDIGIVWCDGGNEPLPRKNIGISLQPGTLIEIQGNIYTTSRYSKKGCHLQYDRDATMKRAADKEAVANPADKATQSKKPATQKASKPKTAKRPRKKDEVTTIAGTNITLKYVCMQHTYPLTNIISQPTH